MLGPPRSIIADSIPVPTEVPLKSSNDADIGDITSDSEVETTTKSKSNAPFNSENPMDDSALKQHENEADWNQSKDNEKQINISSIGLPTWNTFGASNLFAPPQENSSAHANSSWALRNGEFLLYSFECKFNFICRIRRNGNETNILDRCFTTSPPSK